MKADDEVLADERFRLRSMSLAVHGPIHGAV